jgi:two-component system, response regulator PdtaR
MNAHPSLRATVLVVEDDFLVRDCAATALGEQGFRVLQAANGPEGLLLLEKEQPDVVFTDVNMPGAFDGLGLARRVRLRWPHIAVVITSGRGGPDQELEGTRFLPKPYMPDMLARVMDDALARNRRPNPASKAPCLAG